MVDVIKANSAKKRVTSSEKRVTSSEKRVTSLKKGSDLLLTYFRLTT